ncbi:PAS domain S-box protein [Geobacter sp. SVR]|uniref:PAS domain S-box protein n=1 Tax=Geobacter sp. SVR TaxID=2495594 RepID=UPI00143EF60E|nr:PAS domain S-box protein [Geobacter sp. SVR]BCS52245.1 hypothetical protein GSVR_05530 [Geobacter sp. SVR]GCF85094.1 hypothetical protein GSbR_16940 [Geobacter sp. SVR]
MEASTIKVLVFEDNPAHAAVIQEILTESRKPAFTVQHVRYLAEGLERLSSSAFDVILIDLGLPDSQGLETALAVRKQATLTPIVVMTALDDEETALKALQLDIQDYLIKGEITGNLLKRSIRYAIQRKQDTEALRQSEQRFTSFMLHLPAAAWMKDQQGRYVYGNGEHERIFSLPFSEYSNKRDEEFLAPETAQQLRENDERVLTEGESLQINEVLRRADGIEHHFIVSKFPIPGPDGQVAYVAGIALDITEQKRAEEAMQKSERKLAKIFHAVPAILGISTVEEGRFVDINENALELLGYRRDEMIGRTALELGLWEEMSERTRVLQALEEKGSIRNVEVRLRGKSGQTLVCLFSGEFIDIDGERYLLSLIRDITDRRRAEEALQKSEKKFVKVFNAAPALLAVSTLEDGMFLNVNDTMVRTLGYRRDEMIGRTGVELDLWEDMSERATLLQVLEEKGSVKNVEVRLRGKNGQHLVGLFSAEYIDIDGDRYMLSLVKDITLKKRAQEKVERLNIELVAANKVLADDLEAMKILQKIGMLFLHEESLEQILSQVLEAAIGIAGADFGNIQIINPATSSLQIAVQHGFPQWWLDYWNRVAEGKGMRGTALGHGERVIVEDIEHNPIFSGTEVLEIQLRVGVRAVQSTPLVSRSGSLLGMLSTHYKAPHRPNNRELRLLDLLARHAADFIEETRLREMLEARVQQSEERFAAFMSHLPSAAWMKDLTGRFVYANTEVEHLFSIPFAEYSGKTEEEFLPPETARQLRENDELVLAGGKSMQTIEVLTLSDEIEHHFIVSKFVVPGPDGRAAYLAGLAQDITERVRAEEALHASEERFRALVTASSQVLYRMSPDGSEMRQLSSKGFLASTETPSSDWLQRYIPPEDQLQVIAELQYAIRTKSMYELEHRVWRADGGLGWVLSRAVPLMDANGKIVEWFGAANDITERVETERAELAARAAELEEANRELEAFNYTVAHDLRKPLATINGYCQIILGMCGDRLDGECRNYLQSAYDGTWRMSRLIDALLNFSRASRIEPRREGVDLSGLAQAVAVELKLTELARRVDFRIVEGLSVIGDADLLRVVLANLIGNAWKYTGNREEAVIEFGVMQVGEEEAYFVRDNGPGFAMADAGKLFLPFQRVAGNEFAGHGIGLATVERIIRRHGGRIWAEGEPGKGAVFYFTLSNTDKASH